MTESEELNQSVKVLIRYEQKLASMKWAFLRGVFYGFGFFVGSVILVTIFLYVLNRLHLENDNFLAKIILKIVENAQSSR